MLYYLGGMIDGMLLLKSTVVDDPEQKRAVEEQISSVLEMRGAQLVGSFSLPSRFVREQLSNLREM